LHRKLGFIQEGRLREEYFYNGKHHDEILFGMTVGEYKAANGISD
jgi:RimJ/RimL family protein N-acetyltransferase